MKSLFDKTVLDEIVHRISALSPDSPARWGKMNAAQMLAHCKESVEMALGRNKPKRMLAGRIFGSYFKSFYTNKIPFLKNLPTAGSLRITNQRDFQSEKSALISILEEFQQKAASGCTDYPHPLLGTLRPDEWSMGTYKHLDHHLRQFGV